MNAPVIYLPCFFCFVSSSLLALVLLSLALPLYINMFCYFIWGDCVSSCDLVALGDIFLDQKFGVVIAGYFYGGPPFLCAREVPTFSQKLQRTTDGSLSIWSLVQGER